MGVSVTSLLLLFASLTTVHCSPDTRHLSSRVVDTRYGSLRGYVRTLSNRNLEPVEVFLGVPYAGAPIGALRFMPPVTSPHWRGVKLAEHFAPVCPQNLPDVENETEALTKMPVGRLKYMKRLLPFLSNQSEDCLYLNLYVPTSASRDTEKLSVMVFIHGESYDWNAGNPYDGSALASFGGVIVITMNYRLGILGFLPAVDRSARGNYALMDQVAALHWIQDNIAEFGGNPKSVTIFGQGHGAACVNLLMLSPMAAGLFHRAIIQSGSALSPWAIARDAVSHTRKVADELSCPHHDNTALVECLRKVPLRDLLAVKLTVPDYLTGFGPTIDGIVLPKDPALLMAQKTSFFSRYDLLLGMTRVESYFKFSAEDEKKGITGTRRDQLITTLVKNLYTYHQHQIFLTVVNEYMDWTKPILNASDIFDGTSEALGDAVIVAPLTQVSYFHARVVDDAFSSSTQRSSGTRKTYFYVFSHQTDGGDYESRLGCVTGEDMPYVFGAPYLTTIASHFSKNYTRSEMALSEAVMSYWANFAKVGDPNSLITTEKDPKTDNVRSRYEKTMWPEFDVLQQKYLYIGMKPRVKDHYHAHRLSYWLNLIPQVHTSGNVNITSQHHRLHESSGGNFLYDLTIRNITDIHNKSIEDTKLGSNGPLENKTDVQIKSKKEKEEIEKKYDPLGFKFSLSSPALKLTVAVGCSLLALNILVFTLICCQKSKNKRQKKMLKATYQQDEASGDEESSTPGKKPFILKDLSPQMMFSPLDCHQEFDSAQTLDLVQLPKPMVHKSFKPDTSSNPSSTNSLLVDSMVERPLMSSYSYHEGRCSTLPNRHSRMMPTALCKIPESKYLA